MDGAKQRSGTSGKEESKFIAKISKMAVKMGVRTSLVTTIRAKFTSIWQRTGSHGRFQSRYCRK